jgi:hypothetical protein
MAGILLEIGNKYTDEREKQFYLQGQNDIRHLQIILYLCILYLCMYLCIQ